MPKYLIERNFAHQLSLDKDKVAGLTQVNEDLGAKWLFSFLSADKKKTYCLYEAPSADIVRETARLSGLPADTVIEVSDLNPAMFA